jgi:hypothetical protein
MQIHSFFEKSVFEHPSTEVPKGYNYFSRAEEDGYINLEYIDIFDYLPKEYLSDFKKSLQKCVRRNGYNSLWGLFSAKDFKNIDEMGHYYDSVSYAHLLSVKFKSNQYLSKYCYSMQISLRNLSSSLLITKFRLCINKDFNIELNKVINAHYESKVEFIRQFNMPWYKPNRFGRTFPSGDDIRNRNMYRLISSLKWEALKEIRKTFKCFFFLQNVFPPVFETYSTNIRPVNNYNDRRHGEFWHSVMLNETVADYSLEYNACVCWENDRGNFEGTRLIGYCGGDYPENMKPRFVQHELADVYAIYLVASTLNNIARHDIALCNKKMSVALKSRRTQKLLNSRVDIEKKLYYSRRFVNDFTGDTIDKEELSLRNDFFKISITSNQMKQIVKKIAETRALINEILGLISDAIEYKSSKSNITIQFFMLVIALLSLIIAALSISSTNCNSNLIHEWLKGIIAFLASPL